MNGLDMLRAVGVRILEDPGLPDAACWVAEINLLVVRPGISQASIARAVDMVMMDEDR